VAKAKSSANSLFQPPPGMKPLAERMRPATLDDMVGQRRLLAPNSALRRAIESGHVHSMILWGPPGCGKTTLALLLAKYSDAEFKAISAVLSGLPDVRLVLAEAEARFNEGRRTVLFVDEVHRFNKAQQDAFLPHIERGSILFVGATTENPSFELNSALLSRCRVHVLEAVGVDDIAEALRRALADKERGLGQQPLRISDEHLRMIAQAADGDVRRGLTLLEIAAELATGENNEISAATLEQVLADRTRRFDKQGEQFYDQISALHKSVRSPKPDRALYWLTPNAPVGVDPAHPHRVEHRPPGAEAGGPGREAGVAQQRVEPHGAPAALVQALHLEAQRLGVAVLQAVRHQQHALPHGRRRRLGRLRPGCDRGPGGAQPPAFTALPARVARGVARYPRAPCSPRAGRRRWPRPRLARRFVTPGLPAVPLSEQ